jgi:hypothetical protein
MGRRAMGDRAITGAAAPVADMATGHPRGNSSPWTWVAGGAVCGLAWSAALRGYMVELVGAGSTFTWTGTFGALLLPGAVTGGLLGWAEYLRRSGPPRGWRWLALAPLTLAAAPMLMPGAVTTLATTGIGGGAIAVGLMGIVGGYALSGRGRRWPRVVCGVAGVGFAAALAATVPGMTNPSQSLTDPRGAWAAVLAGSIYAVLALGCSIPHRRAVSPSVEPLRSGRVT